MKNPLKSVSVDQIQLAIAEALAKLTGHDCVATVTSAEYDESFNATMRPSAESKISLTIQLTRGTGDTDPPF